MQKGAIAVLDVLGFKGIWRSRPPDQLLGALKTVVGYAETFATGLQAMRQPSTAPTAPVRDLVPWRLLTRAFSDTLILACVMDDPCPSLDSHHGRGPNTNLAAVPEMKVAMRNAVRQIVELTPVTTTS